MRREIWLFSIAGTIGFAVDATVLYGALATGLGYYFGRVVSFLCAATATWIINRQFTFSAHKGESLWREWSHYILAMSAGGAINFSVYSVAVISLHDWPFLPLIAIALGTAAGLTLNFAFAKWWIFKK